MRILLANHQLEDRAGSELWCMELATALRDAGHEVGAFTFMHGGVSQQMQQRGIRLFHEWQCPELEAFAPEAIHLQHSPCLYFLGALRLEAPVVYSVLGAVPPLESAPVVWEGVGHATYVSEEVRDAVRDTRFAKAVPGSLLRNWFDDRPLRQQPRTAPAQIRRIAVVSNHLDAQLKEHLDALCQRRPGVEWVHLGMPNRSIPIDEEALAPFDLVITIGRTVLLAGAMGKPCLIYDVHGCDGLLEASRVEALASRNFSGRLERRRPSLEELEHLVFEQAPRVAVDDVAAALWRGYRLTERVRALEQQYRALKDAGGPTLADAARTGAYSRLGRLYADLLWQWPHWRGRATEAEAARAELTARVEQRERELQAARASEADSTARAAQLELQHPRLLEENRRLAEKLQALETSLAWKTLSSLRAAKDTLLPSGSWQRKQYDRALQAAKKRTGLGD